MDFVGREELTDLLTKINTHLGVYPDGVNIRNMLVNPLTHPQCVEASDAGLFVFAAGADPLHVIMDSGTATVSGAVTVSGIVEVSAGSIDVANIPHVVVDNNIATNVVNVPHVVIDNAPHVIVDSGVIDARQQYKNCHGGDWRDAIGYGIDTTYYHNDDGAHGDTTTGCVPVGAASALWGSDADRSVMLANAFTVTPAMNAPTTRAFVGVFPSTEMPPFDAAN